MQLGCPWGHELPDWGIILYPDLTPLELTVHIDSLCIYNVPQEQVDSRTMCPECGHTD